MVLGFPIFRSAVVAVAFIVAADCQAAPQHTQSRPSIFEACDAKAQTQRDLDECADAEYRATKARFEKAWRDVMGYIDDQKQCAELKAAQKAWLAYRDAECSRWANSGGTVEVMQGTLCLAHLTQARIKDLDAWPPLISREDQKPLPDPVCRP
jgi:uncharacterized protein YecT (DUF1311 family)